METETVTSTEAMALLGISRAWLYKLIENGRIRVVERGRRGKLQPITLVKEDVLREKVKRAELLEARLRGMKDE